MTDKRNGQTYERLLAIEDAADIADGWHRGIAVNDEVFTSVASPAEVAVTADGRFKATLRIRVAFDLPECFLFDVMRRSERRVPMTVTHHVTLRRGGDRIEVRTEVDNTVRDHRVRVLLPSGAAATTYLADAPFDVIERSIALRPDNERYKELEVETKPQQSWTAVFDERRGLAAISAGLPESAVRDVRERPIALTLLRSFAKTPFTGHSEQGGQIQGRHAFSYWIVPLAGKPDAARLCRLGQALAAGVRAVQVEGTDWARPGLAGDEPGSLPPMQSFLEIDSPQAVLTAVYRPEGHEGTVVRVFNPASEPARATIRFAGGPSDAQRTDLEGRPLEPVRADGDRLTIEMAPRQIVSLRIGGPASM